MTYEVTAITLASWTIRHTLSLIGLYLVREMKRILILGPPTVAHSEMVVFLVCLFLFFCISVGVLVFA